MLSTIAITFFGLLMVTAGAMLAEVGQHALKGQLVWFYAKRPVQVYLAVGGTVLALGFLWLNAREALAERARRMEEREFSDVSFGITGVSYKTTPAIRTAVFSAMYLLGIALFVFFA